ncbi:MAG TPA: ComEC/Rec2 family competence protein [Lacipirellulaceae bacterium]|nr:ComEC/Rec2 family competence protein [Lacipirellulaceae bacterium]
MAPTLSPMPPAEGPDQTRATPYRPLLWVAGAACVGAAVDYTALGESPVGLVPVWWAAAAAALALARAARRRPAAATLLLLAASAALGGAWEHWRWNYVAARDLGLFATQTPQPACVTVLVAGRVRITPPAQGSPLRAMPAQTISEATVRVTAIRDGAAWRQAEGQSRLRVAGELRGVEVGARLVVFAQLGEQQPPLNPGEYDWAAAERRAGRHCELYCQDPQCVIIAQGAAWRPSRAVQAIRAWCTDRLAASIAPRDVPLVLATLLGDQERLSDATKDAFLQTGSIHLLVISGAHVAMLAGIVWSAGRAVGLAPRWQLGATLTAVILYAAVVGHEPSVTRATLLVVALIGALELGRRAAAGNLLGAAALVLSPIYPNELFRSGTQFSFVAVAALVAAGRYLARPRPVEPLDRLIAQTRPWPQRLLRHAARAGLMGVAVSMIVGVVVAPLVAYHFHVITPASVLLTPIASPLVGVAIASGLALVTIGWAFPPLAPLLGWICGGTLHLTEQMVTAAQGVPGAFGYCASPGPWWLCVLYGVGGLMAAVPSLRPGRTLLAALAMLWAAVGYYDLGAERTGSGELRCTFLAVGHGTCVVLELPGGQTILYDAGSLGSPETAVRILSGFLWERGIPAIDAIVLSHADIDHYNAAPGLLERFPVGVAYVSPMMFDPVAAQGDLAAPNYLRDELAAHGVPLREVWMNDRLATADADVSIDVLHPPRQGMLGRDNANSILLCVQYAGRRILLTGDLESPGIERVMADPPLDCDVLLAPHHGSDRSDPPGFAAWSSPEWVVMSGARPERTLASLASYQQAGARVLHTAEVGAATVVLTSQGVRAEWFTASASAPGAPR